MKPEVEEEAIAEECEGQIDMVFPFYGYLCPDADGGVRLSMITVHPTLRREGRFAGLIEELKEEYNTIRMPVPLGAMKSVLEKWGFAEFTEFDESIGEDVVLMLWKRLD